MPFNDCGEAIAALKPLLLAHRGTFEGSQYFPGNNQLGWEQVAGMDAHAVLEMDVWQTSNSVPTFFHNKTLDSDTNATGTIASHPWSYIKDHKYDNGQPIPGYVDVRQVADKFPYVIFVVDLKANLNETAWGKLAADWVNFKGRVIFYSSTDNAYTLEAKAKGYATAYYLDGGQPKPSVATILKYGTYAYTGSASAYTQAQRDAMKANGIRIIGWGQDSTAWQNEFNAGAWAVSTNLGDKYLAWSPS
jgi:hypothetical protein